MKTENSPETSRHLPEARDAIVLKQCAQAAMGRARSTASRVEAGASSTAPTQVKALRAGDVVAKQRPTKTKLIDDATVDEASSQIVRDLPQQKATDPRWDVEAFEAWACSTPLFLRLGTLRQLRVKFFEEDEARAPPPSAKARLKILREAALASSLPTDAGSCQSTLNLYAALSASLGREPEDALVELDELIEVLEAAGADDLVFWDACVPCPQAERYRLFTYYRVQAAILPRTRARGSTLSLFERLEPMAYLALSVFSQRIANAHFSVYNSAEADGSSPLQHRSAASTVRIDLQQLMDLPNTLATLWYDTPAELGRVEQMLEETIDRLVPVAVDDVGFRIFIEDSSIAWLRADYAIKLAASDAPIPRFQDLDPAGLIIGAVPRGRKLGVSHAWDTQYHISPSNAKMRALKKQLEQLGATGNDDGVFLDYVSLSQHAPPDMPSVYFEALGGRDRVAFLGRTALQKQQFGFALWQMSRIYAYKEMEVIVLPQPAVPASFPQGTGRPLLCNGAMVELQGSSIEIFDETTGESYSPPKLLLDVPTGLHGDRLVLSGLHDLLHERIDLQSLAQSQLGLSGVALPPVTSTLCAWGFVGEATYASRGWPCSEYSIARFCGRIKNADDPAVVALEASRQWPLNVPEYSSMMDPAAADPVAFTSKGDRDIVQFFFYRVCFGLQHAFKQDTWSRSLDYVPPTEEAFEAANRAPVGEGNLHDEYYLAVHVQPPTYIVGDGREKAATALHQMLIGALMRTGELALSDRFPLAFGDASASKLLPALRKGKLFALAWAPSGSGDARCTYGECAHGSDAVTLDALCAAIAKLHPRRRPRLLFVVTPFCAAKQARRLAEAGAPLVIFVGESLLDAERATTVIFGVIAPAIERLRQPQMLGASPDVVVSVVQELGESCFGGGWLFDRDRDPRIPLGCLGTVPKLRKWQPSKAAAQSGVRVHNLARAQPRVLGTATSAELHETLKIYVRDTDGKPADVLCQCSPERVHEWIGTALPRATDYRLAHHRGQRHAPLVRLVRKLLPAPARLCLSAGNAALNSNVGGAGQQGVAIAEMYDDEDPNGTPVLQVLVHIPDVAMLYALRDTVLDGSLERCLASSRTLGVQLQTTVDRSHFAAAYERSTLTLDKLTPHQEAALAKCLGGGASVHLMAPAGGGKTFVAMQLLLHRLESDRDATVLFVARNASLCLFVARWLCKRIKKPILRIKLLKRFFVLCEPLEDGPRTITLKNYQLKLSAGRDATTKHHGSASALPGSASGEAATEGPPARSGAGEFTLLITDEAHHIYAVPQLRRTVEQHVGEGTRRLLLSDVSQATEAGILYPPGLFEVLMTEVVRSTGRIVAGAAAFQQGDLGMISSQHNVPGPPLKTFLFPPLGRASTSRCLAGLAARQSTDCGAEEWVTIRHKVFHAYTCDKQ